MENQSSTAASPWGGEAAYDTFQTQISACFHQTTGNGVRPLFTTDAAGLFEAYLAGFPEGPTRQHYHCSACRLFIERHAGLVTIDEKGLATPALLNIEAAPEPFQRGVADMGRIVRRAAVTGVFLSSQQALGTPVTGAWRHLSVTLPASALHLRTTQSAGQAMAEKRADYATVCRALAELTLPMLKQALTLLKTESLYRSERVIGPAQWLADLHVAREAALNKANVTWLAVASAPAGYCHPRSSMIGTLLEDIAAGLDFEEVARRFAAKMHPLQYQRPQAAPSAATIAQAEKIVAQLGAAGSLARRFARVEEVEAIWKPAQPDQAAARTGGVFSHLKTREETPPATMALPPVTMTWVKFSATVLAEAERIEFVVRAANDNFTALLTAVNPDAPPILQWDLPERRNPVSWYVWTAGSPPGQWGLRAGMACPVSAITLKPSMWGQADGFEHQGQAVIFLLEGARETRFDGGICLFPEMLKSEFHGIRRVIEAYSRTATLEGKEGATACGIMLQKGGSWEHVFRVTARGQSVDYRLDRWD
jgi:hypothetical protein